MTEDTLVIPIYQSEHNADGTSAIHNDHVFDVVITGDEIGQIIPVGSDVDITIKVNRSQMLKLEAFFPLQWRYRGKRCKNRSSLGYYIS